eukprot:m.26123 g.26123  ORF g.26123 m.26123 type:complete len:1624 (+) comp4292_c0_seq2:1079-5950(+)
MTDTTATTVTTTTATTITTTTTRTVTTATSTTATSTTATTSTATTTTATSVTTTTTQDPNALAATDGDGSADSNNLVYYIIAAVVAVLVIGFLLYKVRSRRTKSSDLEGWGGGGGSKQSAGIDEVPLIPEVEPFRLPVPASLPSASIVSHLCRTCKKDWCNYPEIRRMEITKFEDEQEFVKLPQCSFNLEDIPILKEDPKLVDSIAPLNRYRNINPNPSTLVRLQALDGDPVTTYTNANFVAGALGNPNQYIACQGPLRETMWDFWRMVWEQRSNVIIMTTGLVEKDRQKCYPYWPQKEGEHLECKTLTSKKSHLVWFHVKHTGSVQSKDGKYTRTTLVIRKGGETDEDSDQYNSRVIHHFWYNTWPDHGVPDDYGAVSGMLQDVRSYSNGEPWVVHCSAGVGRTGSFIGIDVGTDLLKRYGKVDLLKLITHLRECRGQSIQSPQQAMFVYWTLEKFASKWNKDHGFHYCPRCTFETADESKLDEHMAAHKPELKCPVDGCAFTTEDEGDLEEHGAIHRPPEFRCPQCAFVSTDEEAYDDHKEAHAVLCSVCGFKAYSQVEIDEHELEEHDKGEGLFPNFIPTDHEDTDMVKFRPKWLHGPMHREDSDALLTGNRGRMPGSFLVKRLHEMNAYELACVPSNGARISHHKITRDRESGFVAITLAKGQPQVLGPYRSINEMLAAFSKRHSQWPLILSSYVPCTDQAWGAGDALSCTCADNALETDATGGKVYTRRGAHTVPFRRRASFEETALGSATSDRDFPPWVDLTRQMAENLVTFGGSPEGTWLLRELTPDRLGICVVFGGRPTHHLIHRVANGTCELNGSPTPQRSIRDVVRVLREQPESLQWPLRLDPGLFIRPWRVGDVVSAPYSADGKMYDGVLVDIFPSGNFRNIPVNLARVSYVGYASENDDCVPINLLRPPTGHENPDFYTPGGLASALQSGLFQLGEDDVSRKRRLTMLHEEALSRELVVDVSTADAAGLVLDSAGKGTFIVDVKGKLAEDKVLYPGLQILRIENTDTEAASPELIRTLLAQRQPSCEVVLKVNPPLFAEVIAKRSAPHRPQPSGPVVTSNGDTMIAVNPAFEIPAGISYTVPSGAKSHGLKWVSASDGNGCFIQSVKVGSAGDGVVSEGLRLARIDNTNVMTLSKSDAIKAIRAARQDNNGAVTLHFVEDPAGYAMTESNNGNKGPSMSAAATGTGIGTESAPSSSTAPPSGATVDALLMASGKLGISFVGNEGQSFVSKVAPGGAGEASGLVSVGQQLLKVNGEDVSRAGKDGRNAALKRAQASGQVLLTLQDNQPGFAEARRVASEAKRAKQAAPATQPAGETIDVVFTEQAKLGISFVNRDNHGNWISQVKAGSPAEATGKLRPGLKLLNINGEDVSTTTKVERNRALKQAWSAGQITMSFMEDMDGYKLALEAQSADTSEAPSERPRAAAQHGSGVVEVVFTEQSKLGLTFVTLDGPGGNYVAKVKPGAAAKTGKIKEGHKLLSVNGKDMSRADSAARSAAIKDAWISGRLSLTFGEDPVGFKRAMAQKDDKSLSGPVATSGDVKSGKGKPGAAAPPKAKQGKKASQKAKASKKSKGPNPYLEMDRREVMKRLRQGKVEYDRTAPLEELAALAYEKL